MKPVIIITLLAASTITAISWCDFCKLKHPPHMKHSDHQSSLSKEDYKRGDLREKDVIKRMTPRMTRELSGLAWESPWAAGESPGLSRVTGKAPGWPEKHQEHRQEHRGQQRVERGHRVRQDHWEERGGQQGAER